MLIHRILVFFLSFMIALPATVFGNISGEDPTLAAFENEMAKLDVLMSFAQDIEKATNRDAYDLEAVLEKADYEAEELIEFAKKNINFELYRGTLRGALGTLLSQGGNSLDQSIFLAKLLRDAGIDARIARTTLDESSARQLLNELRLPPAVAFPIGDGEAFAAAFENAGLVDPLNPQQKQAMVSAMRTPQSASEWSEYKKVLETTQFITASLDRENISLGSGSDINDLLEEAKDYFWVELKELDSSDWRSVHPAFRQEPDFTLPKKTEVFTESIPEELQHRLRFQVFIERKAGNKLESIPIMSPWERPVANLVDQPVTFANISDTMMSGAVTSFDISKIAEDVNYYAPGFRGGLAPGAKFFDLSGNLIDPMVASEASAGFVKQIGRAFGDASKGLGGKDTLPFLSAQWMEFTLIEPGGKETAFKRTIFDLVGQAARESGNLSEDLAHATSAQARSLLKRSTFMMHTGKVSPAFAGAFGARRLSDTRGAFEAILRQEFDQPEQSSVNSGSIEDLSADWLGHLSLFTVFDKFDSLSTSHKVYRSAPALVIQSEGLGEDGFVAAIDIVTNPRRAIRIDGQHLVHDPHVLVRAGIWETLFEGMALPDGEQRISTWNVFADAIAKGAPINVVSDTSKLEKLNLSEDAKAAIQTDLNRGFVAIVPGGETVQPYAGWWRVDPETGSTLGQIGDGRGSELVKYIAIGVSFGFVAWGTTQCAAAKDASAVASACCMTSNALWAVAGMLIGIWVGVPLTAWATVAASAGIDVMTAFVFGPETTEACVKTYESLNK